MEYLFGIILIILSVSMFLLGLIVDVLYAIRNQLRAIGSNVRTLKND